MFGNVKTKPSLSFHKTRHLSLEEKEIFQKDVYRNVKILGIKTDVNTFSNIPGLSVRAEDLGAFS